MRTTFRSIPVRTTSALAGVVIVAILAGLRVGGAFGSGGEYTIDVPTGMTTRLAPDAVVQIALRDLERMQSRAQDPVSPIAVMSVRATTRGATQALEPNSIGTASASEVNDIVWVVRAQGTFVGERVLPGMSPIVSSTGYLLIDDATGSILGTGMP